MTQRSRIKVRSLCRRLSRANRDFVNWLSAYRSEHPESWLGQAKSHVFFAVPIDLMNAGAHKVLARGRDHCYLRTCIGGEAVLAVAV
jgi:hypothetical protein